LCLDLLEGLEDVEEEGGRIGDFGDEAKDPTVDVGLIGLMQL